MIKIERFERNVPDITYWNILSDDKEWHDLCRSLNFWNEYLKPFAVKYGWKPTDNLPY